MGKREPGTATPPTGTRGGGYYLDDGPGANPPADIDSIPDAVPRIEPLQRGASRPYTVMGKTYTPMTVLEPYKARGVASWYGRRYDGKMTASGEIYDMYGMTAAHPTLPIPSYARVTNLASGRSVVVRINDRGPFIDNRLIDLSYTAAHKLGILSNGSAMVEVESIIPGQTAPTAVAAVSERAIPRAVQENDSTITKAAPAPMVTSSAVPKSNAMAAAIAPPQVPLSRDATGVYLQLGAFGSKQNAENYLTKLRAQVEWLTHALHLYLKDGLFRVHAGPYTNVSQAREIAERISQSLGIRPIVLVR